MIESSIRSFEIVLSYYRSTNLALLTTGLTGGLSMCSTGRTSLSNRRTKEHNPEIFYNDTLSPLESCHDASPNEQCSYPLHDEQ